MSTSSLLSGFRSLPISIAQLTLSAVLKCGQSFRWQEIALENARESDPQREYRLALHDRVICLRQTREALWYRARYVSTVGGEDAKEKETLDWIRRYFQLDVDLVQLYSSWSLRDPVFRKVREGNRFEGIRILRQDPWECLISFICSSNNNIARITKMVQNLCTNFSSPLPFPATADESNYHAFPPPSALAAPTVEQRLRELGFGYRAGFLQKTAAMLFKTYSSNEGVYQFLHGLRKRSTEDAREELLKLMGVGRKVADCILLMSLDKRDVVPLDTHLLSIANRLYHIPLPKTMSLTPQKHEELQTKLKAIWGEWAGWTQTVMFTADLKSFQNYNTTPTSPGKDNTEGTIKSGLLTPSPTPSPMKRSKSTSSASQLQGTPTTLPSKKRKRSQPQHAVPESVAEAKEELVTQAVDALKLDLETELIEGGGLLDRVKRRRRNVVNSKPPLSRSLTG